MVIRHTETNAAVVIFLSCSLNGQPLARLRPTAGLAVADKTRIRITLRSVPAASSCCAATNEGVKQGDACGSSSGSAVSAAIGLAAATLGTETAGSITCPASYNNVVGVKATVGLTSRNGGTPLLLVCGGVRAKILAVIPVSEHQDTVDIHSFQMPALLQKSRSEDVRVYLAASSCPPAMLISPPNLLERIKPSSNRPALQTLKLVEHIKSSSASFHQVLERVKSSSSSSMHGFETSSRELPISDSISSPSLVLGGPTCLRLICYPGTVVDVVE
ncbi:hypothetical protein FB451DRAFT_1470420 [Mycena latifolia]|nr:hypothetical protein FB451DRAFT_1470420 [Mycena latifolia]